jgi:hypothetical protein
MSQPVDESNSREGNAELIAGVGLFDTPEPGTGKAFLGAGFPGNGTLVVYPGSEVRIDAGGIEISADDANQPRMRARPRVAAIECDGDQIRFHPPAFDPLLRAVARVAEQFDIDTRDPIALLKLVGALIGRHYPDMLLPAGRVLSSDERAMSIAWVVDQERQDNEPSPDAIRRARPKLLDYRLIDDSLSQATLKRLFNEGQALLRRLDMEPWRQRSRGRPRRNGTPRRG